MATAMARLRTQLGDTGLLTDADSLARYAEDRRGRYQAHALAVARPANTPECAEVVAVCRAHGIAIVTRGGGTGLVGGASATGPGRELLLSAERLRRVRKVDVAAAAITLEAGCTLAAARAAAAGAGLMLPLSMASEGSASIGGNLATNAGGNLTMRHGNTRQLALGLEVVLADGRVLDMLSSLRKDNSGYDLKQLFIGSEGTLGVITAATLALSAVPRQQVCAWCALPAPQAALALLARCRGDLGETLSAFELMPRLALDFVLKYLPAARDPCARPHPWYVLLQADSALPGDWLRDVCEQSLSGALASSLIKEAVIAESEQQRADLWRLREAISPAQRCGGASIKHDIAIPVDLLATFIDTVCAELARAVPGIRPCVFGHIGDGNLHFNLSRPIELSDAGFMAREADCNRIVFDHVVSVGGSIAAEHGIGQLRRMELARRADPVKLDLLRRIKQALDPDDLMNPGKLLPEKFQD